LQTHRVARSWKTVLGSLQCWRVRDIHHNKKTRYEWRRRANWWLTLLSRWGQTTIGNNPTSGCNALYLS